MYHKLIEESDTIYELDEECVNRKKEERENKVIQKQDRKEKSGQKS